MKKSLIVAASALAMAATPAFAVAPGTVASGDSSTITLAATVDNACGVGNHMSGATSDPLGDQSGIDVDLDDANGQYKTATTYNRSFGNVWCNGPAQLTVTATPLSTTTPVGDGDSFTNTFDLQVSGSMMDTYMGGASIDTSTGTDTATYHRPVAFETGLRGYSTVNITVLPSLRSGEPRRAVEGTYAGSVVFTVAAG